jgi:AAA+ ATPase superfamily predicted ATPase
MFVGRDEDLKFLESEYQRDKFSFIPIYGRRRVGKTTLIREFIKDKTAIYYQAAEEKKELNIERLSQTISQLIYPGLPASIQMLPDFQAIFDAITDYAKDNRLIFIIDEYPYLAKAAPEVSSLIQHQIDHVWKDVPNLKLILCGSSMSFMERQVLGYKSPLYGRRTGQIKLKPFDFYQTREYFMGMDSVELAEIYAITGGIPQYLEQVNPNLSTIENIQRMFLTKNSFLLEEPQNLLKQELENPSNYNSILSAIAEGKSKLNEISTKVGIPSSNLTRYLENLMDLQIIEKKVPTGEPPHKKGIYRIKDTMFQFWFRFIAPNISLIEIDNTKGLSQLIEKQLNDFMGPIFEEICISYLWKLTFQDEDSALYRTFGSWWGNNSKLKQQEEIDILGLGFENDQNILLGECKWRNQLTDVQVLENLVRRSELFTQQNKNFYVFSKSGFTESAVKYSKTNQIHLVTYDEIYGMK